MDEAGTVVARNNDYSTSQISGANPDDWDLPLAQRLQWEGGATNLDPATGRISLGATDVGNNIFTLADPGFTCYLRVNDDDSISARTPAQVAVHIGALTDVPAGATIYVDNDNGDDSTGARGSQILPFKTLAVAFTQALSGDVIYVSPGTYDQGTTALVIPSNVTVVGSGADSSAITGSIPGLTRCEGRETRKTGCLGRQSS